MMKKRYLTPQVRQITSFDQEFQIICTSNDRKTLDTVDPFDEKYYGKTGDESFDDYLIKL